MNIKGRCKKYILPIIQLMRPQSVLLMLLFIYLPILKVTGDFCWGIYQVIPLFFMLVGEIILNDLVDIPEDKIDKKHRPLAAGTVSMLTAKCLIIVFLMIAIVLGGRIFNNELDRFILFFSIFIVLTIYSLFKKKIAVIKGMITAFVTVLCLCFVFTYQNINQENLAYLIGAFFYIYSREILMDVRDYDGDKINNYKTIAVQFGKDAAYKIAKILMFFSQVAYVYYLQKKRDVLSVILWGAAIMVLKFLFKKFQYKDTEEQNKIIILMWIPMLLTLPSLLV